ncbi:hypothetical protein Q1695_008698 [Nippostrongylus brasiliensis]|nr:hypothetical protein Q1695_008698 [Nippostrongylus brasiliensis]
MLLAILCLILSVEAFRTDLDDIVESPRNLNENPPFATSFINCNDLDYSSGLPSDISFVRKLFGCRSKPILYGSTTANDSK